MDLLESEIQKQCLQILTAFNIFHWRQNTGAYRVNGRVIHSASINGIADIIGILPDGRFLAVECKRSKGGKVSEVQKDFLQNITKNNGVALVVNDPEQLITFLRTVKK